jgi:hypothetical protein
MVCSRGKITFWYQEVITVGVKDRLEKSKASAYAEALLTPYEKYTHYKCSSFCEKRIFSIVKFFLV